MKTKNKYNYADGLLNGNVKISVDKNVWVGLGCAITIPAMIILLIKFAIQPK